MSDLPRVHVHMSVSDFEKSRAFYEKLFGAPVKVKEGYAKFLPGFGPLNLAISDGQGNAGGHVNHMGIQVESRDAVLRELARVKAAGIPTREEIGVDCCHANQDKFWVQDPDGVEWEVYHLNYDLETEVAAPRAMGLTLAKGGGSCCSS